MEASEKEQEVYKKIEEMYGSENSKGFVNHLIRSFLPLTRSSFMLSYVKEKPMRCALTLVPLMSQEGLTTLKAENHDELINNFKNKILSLEGDKDTVSIDKYKGKYFAIESKSSTKLLSMMALEQLLQFTRGQLLLGNENMNSLLINERKKEENEKSVGKDAVEYKNHNTAKFEKRKEQQKNSNQSNQSNQSNHSGNNNHKKNKKEDAVKTIGIATHSLGDSEVLQKLKKQLEGGEK